MKDYTAILLFYEHRSIADGLSVYLPNTFINGSLEIRTFKSAVVGNIL